MQPHGSRPRSRPVRPRHPARRPSRAARRSRRAITWADLCALLGDLFGEDEAPRAAVALVRAGRVRTPDGRRWVVE